MANLLDIKASSVRRSQQAIVYGAPLTAKTSKVSLFAKCFKLVWVDLDGKFQSIFTALPKEYWGNIELFSIADTPVKQNAADLIIKMVTAKTPFRFCKAHSLIACAECKQANAEYETFDPAMLDQNTILVIDNLSTLSDSMMNKQLNYVDPFKAPDIDSDDYNGQCFALNTMISFAKNLACHTIFIAHEEEVIINPKVTLDGKGKQVIVGQKKFSPAVGTKRFSGRISGKINHVLRTSIVNKAFRISSSPLDDNEVQAGTTSGIKVDSDESLLKIFDVSEAEKAARLLAINAK